MEASFRIGVFLAIFAVVAIWEVLAQRRAWTEPRGRRWAVNIGIILTNILVQRVTVGALALSAATLAETRGWGLFHLVQWPTALEAVLALLILDCAIYLQHILTHLVPVLWRLHRVHHADLDVDVTTGLRFHPVEILLSMLYKSLIVLVLCIDPWVVLIYEAALNGAALFTHANIRLPGRSDATLRLIFCTPDMHRVHHSIDPVETNSNYGNFLSIWDRIGGTMRAAPRLGQDGVILGLGEERAADRLGFFELIAMPFRRK
jgi:sterol desaturase/sphingolipid hydroxylase (fatty acid hydroxylase superfamily)